MNKRFPRLPPPPGQDARLWTFKVRPDEIGYVNCVLENYEGMGIVRTRDEKAGVMEFWLMPGYEDDFRTILDGLMREMQFIPLDQGIPLEGFPDQ